MSESQPSQLDKFKEAARQLGTDDDLVDAVLRFSDLKKQRSRLANWSGVARRSTGHVRPAMREVWNLP